MSDTLLISARDFERDVTEKIFSVLGENEDAQLGIPIGKNSRIITDIFLKNGCMQLDLSAPTFIEIKYVLTLDGGLRVLSTCRDELDKYGGHLLIIYKKKLTDFPLIQKDNALSGRVTLWPYDELEDKIKNHKQHDFQKKEIKGYNNPFELAKQYAATNKVSLFLGAGVSMDAKLPGWNKLLESLLVQEGGMPFKYINEANTAAISNSLADSSIVMGRYIIQSFREAIKGRKSELANDDFMMQKLLDEETEKMVKDRVRKALYSEIDTHTRSKLVKAIASVARKNNVENIITYNFDDLIEYELRGQKKFQSIYDETIERTSGMKPIYHVHGYLPRDAEKSGLPVLSETEYHRLYSHMHHWANVVQLNALYTTTCFFIGFSMTDPNQRRLLDLARNRKLDSPDASKAPHFVFLQRKRLKGEAVEAVNDEHCKEIENMMFELGLNVIWFNDFKELPKCLLEVFEKHDNKPKM